MLLRSLADEGRTVFASGQLMSEMFLTADHLIVIGRGRLLADTSTQEFVRQGSEGRVQVRSPGRDRLAQLPRDQGAAVEAGRYGSLAVRGAAAVGDLAARHGIASHFPNRDGRGLGAGHVRIGGYGEREGRGP